MDRVGFGFGSWFLVSLAVCASGFVLVLGFVLRFWFWFFGSLSYLAVTTASMCIPVYISAVGGWSAAGRRLASTRSAWVLDGVGLNGS